MKLYWLDIIGLFIFLSGFVIGLGAVTVIDIHGFLGRKSSYWSEATARTHKVTKPLIWVGMILAIIGGTVFYRNEALQGIPLVHLLTAVVLIINGPFLLEKEKQGKSQELLPESLQRKIMVSLIVSDIGWWGSLFLLVIYIVQT